MKFTHNHRLLFTVVFLFFLVLTLAVSIIPAYRIQSSYAVLPNSEPLSVDAIAGKKLYIANGCVACHTQQVRNVAMDEVWGDRPSIAADYADMGRISLFQNTATLMGTERTGPDLTNIGTRQPGKEWHLMHLYNPRSVVAESIMPTYQWLFEHKDEPGEDDVVVTVPDEFNRGSGTIVAKKEALQLVEYLLSLKQAPLPDGTESPDFLYVRAAGAEGGAAAPAKIGQGVAPDGKALFAKNCQACHQANGEGLKGVFPSLKGSKVVTNDDPSQMITIIMKGYDARASEGFPPMPPIGTMNRLKPAEVHAIINHERKNWGNEAREIPLEEVEEFLKTLTP